jgi:quercetin dioxygenase-like cupin family protein
MKNWKSKVTIGLTVGVIAAAWGAHASSAEQAGFRRIELERQDIGNPGHEAVLARAEIDPGASAPRHTHPGEEVAYVLEGPITLEVDGKPPAVLQSGDAFFIPAGTVHSARNTGPNKAKILSTYILEKGKPLATLVK